MQTAVRERRFPTSSPITDWIKAAYADIWNAKNWSFKYLTNQTFWTTSDSLSSGSASQTPKMPTDFSRVTSLYDDQGYELRWLEQADFERNWTNVTSTGRPCEFTVVNNRIILGPTPNAAYSFDLSYRRRLATRNSSDTVQAGFFQADTDKALWDDHDYVIVIRAKIIGLRDRSDPTAGDLEGEYVRLLEAMAEEWIVSRPRGAQLPAWR